MQANKAVAVTEEIKQRLDAEKQHEHEPYHAVIQRLLDADEGARSDADDIAAEVTTALANGDVPVTLADGEADRIAQEAREARENGGEAA